jgi:hypothetical protein
VESVLACFPETGFSLLNYNIKALELFFDTYFGPHPMALRRTSAIPDPRLTERALLKHTRAAAKQQAGSEMDNSLTSTYLESVMEEND